MQLILHIYPCPKRTSWFSFALPERNGENPHPLSLTCFVTNSNSIEAHLLIFRHSSPEPTYLHVNLSMSIRTSPGLTALYSDTPSTRSGFLSARLRGQTVSGMSVPLPMDGFPDMKTSFGPFWTRKTEACVSSLCTKGRKKLQKN